MRLKSLRYAFFILAVLGFQGQDLAAAALKSGTEPLRRHISLCLQLRNYAPSRLAKGGLAIYGPVKKTALQDCVSLTANYPFTTTVDSAGNQVLHFAFTGIPAFDNRLIYLKAELALRAEAQTTGEKQTWLYLQPEPYMETQAPEITALAGKLKKKDGLATARAVYAWVAGNIKYAGYTKNPRGALWALRNRTGDCTEYMYLFAALCRAAGVPARGLRGFTTSGNGRLAPENLHDWAEFYHDGKWRLADPQKKNFMENQQHYIAFKILGGAGETASSGFNLFKVEGQGLKAVMTK